MTTGVSRTIFHRAFVLPWVSFVVVTCVLLAAGLQVYTHQMAKEMLGAWYQSEAVAIQEGNLLTALTKSRRILLSSDFVSGISLWKAQPDSGRPLIELGEPMTMHSDWVSAEIGDIKVKPVGPFQAVAVLRLIEDPALVVAFETRPGLIPWLFAFILMFVGGSTFFVIFFVRRSAMQEHALRLKVVSQAIGDLVEDREISQSMASDIPGMSSAWTALRGRLADLKGEIMRQSRLAAVARTTQALAHDVRKPFTMFKMLIDMVDATRDPQTAQKLLKQALPEVQRAMASVNGMIADVMEVGADSKPLCELTNPETLIESTINEIFRVYPDSKVRIAYDLRHAHKVNVDTLKVGRVFSNIVGNAVQAINYTGEIWFRTREVDGGRFVEFCLGNSGSFIQPEFLPKLFEAFFTSEKKGGTGLGLAIAHKIILAHGGRIWCESSKDEQSPQGKVEFFFTLPSHAVRVDNRAEPLPETSKSVTVAFEKLKAQAIGQGAPTDEQESELERAILKKIQGFKNSLSLLIVDDEGVYRNGLENLIMRAEDLVGKFTVHFADNSSEALHVVNASDPFLVVLDVDLGVGSLSGLETVKAMRERGFTGRVCIHSNRFLVDDYRAALDAGANTVLPKPMSRAHFLKVILEALAQRYPEMTPAILSASAKPEIVFIDDTATCRMVVGMKIQGKATLHAFDGARSFWEHVESEPDFLSRQQCVITDFHFAKGESETGVELGEKLKAGGFRRAIALYSDMDLKLDEIRSGIDRIIDKSRTLDWSEIEKIIEMK